MDNLAWVGLAIRQKLDYHSDLCPDVGRIGNPTALQLPLRFLDL